jgi:hypothetical protein
VKLRLPGGTMVLVKKGITRNIILTAVAMEETKGRIIKGKGYFPAKIVPQYG